MVKRLFLSSSVKTPGVAGDIRRKIGGTGNLRTSFIMTPAVPEANSGADMSWLNGEREMLNQSGFATFDYDLAGKTSEQVKQDLADIDVLYISGGNEFYLKQEANKCHFGQFVQDFVGSGKPYIGTSAGSIIMGHDMTPTIQLSDLDDLDDPKNVDTQGFGLVGFTVLPHWGSPHFRELYLNKRLEHAYQPKYQMILLNDHQYVEVKDNWYRIVDVSES